MAKLNAKNLDIFSGIAAYEAIDQETFDSLSPAEQQELIGRLDSEK